jgi:hypothetical protein
MTDALEIVAVPEESVVALPADVPFSVKETVRPTIGFRPLLSTAERGVVPL